MLAHPQLGSHLMHAMSSRGPRRSSASTRSGGRHSTSARSSSIATVAIGRVTIQNHAFLNSEDDASTAAFETAVDLVLLDDAIDVGVLRGAPATHPKYAGRRIFGSGINLTHLYYGKISLVEFMIERELGGVSKMFRGHSTGRFEANDLEDRREKPWIAAVEPSPSAARASGCS